MIDRTVLVETIARGLEQRGYDAPADAYAEKMLAMYERRMCPVCGSKLDLRQDSRHLMPDPLSLHGRDH